MLLIIGLAVTFLSLATLLVVVQQALADRVLVSRTMRHANEAGAVAWDIRSAELSAPLRTRLLSPALRWVSARIRSFAPSGVMERLDLELVHAGGPAGWDGERLLGVKAILMIGLVASAPVWSPAIGFGGSRIFFSAPLGGFVGWFLPEWILRGQSGERQGAIQRALPDALDLMAITVAAGLGFDAALDKVSRELGGPLGQEFHRVVQEMRLGASRSTALRGLRERTRVPDLQSFVLAMIQADTFGISVSKVLQVQAAEIRTRRRQRAEETAQKLPVKILMPLMACIFPSLFVVLLGPAALRIYDGIIAK